jgi:DNA-binding response OmpR family regulator
LFSRADQLVTNATIISRVWGRSADLNKRTLEQHVYKLRAKLARLRCCLRVHAVYGRGYQLLTGSDALALASIPVPMLHSDAQTLSQR